MSVVIEPGLGGRIYAIHSDIGEHLWGEITAWDPPHQLAHTFSLARDPDHPSLVEVAFTPVTGGCALSFAHRVDA